MRADKCLGLRLRKWIDADTGLGSINAWELTPDAIHNALEVMRLQGYEPATVNRDLGALGQVYRWAIEVRRMAPSGFVSPTRNVPRLPVRSRRVEFTDADLTRLRAAAVATRDRRFCAFVWGLTDTGARKSELLERVSGATLMPKRER